MRLMPPWFSSATARKGATVTALDLTPELLARARESAGIAGVTIDFHEGEKINEAVRERLREAVRSAVEQTVPQTEGLGAGADPNVESARLTTAGPTAAGWGLRFDTFRPAPYRAAPRRPFP